VLCRTALVSHQTAKLELFLIFLSGTTPFNKPGGISVPYGIGVASDSKIKTVSNFSVRHDTT
jgi:hypothetical protein